MPRVAMPVARPTMLASASGELNTRSDPNAPCNPAVSLKTPPLPLTCFSRRYSSRLQSATSSPKTTMRWIALHLVLQASVDQVGHGLFAAARLARQRRPYRLGLKLCRRGIQIRRVEILQVRPRLGERRRHGLVGRVLHLVGQVELHLVQRRLVENSLADQELAEARNRVALRFHLALRLGAVQLLVIRQRM